MRYGVLGPFEVQDEARLLDLGRPKQRAVLAMLVLEANSVVSLDRLIDLLWGDERPARSTASLQVYISNLRRILEPHRRPNNPPSLLLTLPPGYLLRIGPGELDADRFEILAAEGRRHLVEGRPLRARRVLDEALAQWRGEALADFSFEKFAATSRHPLGRAAPDRDGGPHPGRPRARWARPGRGIPQGARRPFPPSGTAVGPAHGGALPRRTSGRCPPDVHPGPGGADGGARCRAGARAAPHRGRHPGAGTDPRVATRPRTARRSPRSSSARPSAPPPPPSHPSSDGPPTWAGSTPPWAT